RRSTAGREAASGTAGCKTASPKTADVGTARRAPVGAERAEAEFCYPATSSGACGGQPQCSATAAPRSATATHTATADACRTPASASARRAGKTERAERTSEDKRTECAGQDKSAGPTTAATQYTTTVTC